MRAFLSIHANTHTYLFSSRGYRMELSTRSTMTRWNQRSGKKLHEWKSTILPPSTIVSSISSHSCSYLWKHRQWVYLVMERIDCNLWSDDHARSDTHKWPVEYDRPSQYKRKNSRHTCVSLLHTHPRTGSKGAYMHAKRALHTQKGSVTTTTMRDRNHFRIHRQTQSVHPDR